MLAFAVAVASVCSCAWGYTIRVHSSARLPLSVAQEVDEAIERGQRWLEATPSVATNSTALLRQYALVKGRGAFEVSAEEYAQLEKALKAVQQAPEAKGAWEEVLARKGVEPAVLFALQARKEQEAFPEDWREVLALRLINTQRISAKGGTWGDERDTLWAILTLRALLNESTPLRKSERATRQGAEQRVAEGAQAGRARGYEKSSSSAPE